MSKAGPSVEEFAAFVEAVHGHGLFPWQRGLVERLLAGEDWPDAVDVPTGLGKTMSLDIAVYQAAYGGARRIFFVVNRRIIVDEAHRHAEHLAEHLESASSGVVVEIAERLRGRSLAGPGRPLAVTRMRGGASWERRWIDRPDRVSIVVGTIDQVGSRMLFRAYGASARQAPIDAALVGTDSLLFLDEAHLAAPFVETLHDLSTMDDPEHRVTQPVTVVQLSATPDAARDDVFDLDQHLEHEGVARKRLLAHKQLTTVTCPSKQTLPVMAAYAHHFAEQHAGGFVLVLANTVSRARELFTEINKDLPNEVETVLLTGRNRPFDHLRLLETWLPKLTVGWREAPDPWPTRIVVATQTVEVGANLDADVVVSEACDVTAFVQRLGRLNRVGAAGEACRAVFVQPQLKAKEIPPIYGEAQQHTWEWLTEQCPAVHAANPRTAVSALSEGESIDVSPAALRQLSPPPEQARVEPPRRPHLVQQHLDGWVRTGPIPTPDAPIAPFLHGVQTQDTPVSIVWRADLPEQIENAELLEAVRNSVARLAPRSHEILEVPLGAARAWLRGTPAPVLADTDTNSEEADDNSPPNGERWAVRLTADEDTEIVAPGNIRPGDVLIVPDTYGGLDAHGWNPQATAPVYDVADLGPGERHAFVRLHPRSLPPVVAEILRPADASERSAVAAQVRRQLRGFLDDLDLDEFGLPEHLPTEPYLTSEADEGEPALGQLLQQWWQNLPGERRTELPQRFVDVTESTDGETVLALSSKTRTPRASDSTSTTGGAVLLERHHTQVGDLARDIVTALGLDNAVAKAVELAARWHDLGKLEPRCQAQLHEGDRLAALTALENGLPRAKSNIDPADRAAFREARRNSGYPRDARHEALSAYLAQQLLNGDTELDRDLVVHLTAAHHGYARPLLPPVEDPDHPTKITIAPGEVLDTADFTPVDWNGPARFRRLNRRYGRWGLALLETIVRLADIACSAGEHEDEKSPR